MFTLFLWHLHRRKRPRNGKVNYALNYVILLFLTTPPVTPSSTIPAPPSRLLYLAIPLLRHPYLCCCYYDTNTGSDLANVTIAPGATATSTNAFTFQTAAGTDVITAVTINDSNASATSMIEITSDDSSIVYGSTTNPIRASTVTCVAVSSPLGGAKTCMYSSPSRSTNYYFKLFTKDTTGNYSVGIAANSVAFIIAAPTNGGKYSIERESQNGATTTVSGGIGNKKGGYGDTGTTTTTTTTVATSTPTKGGGGDSGVLYFKNNLATFKSINTLLSEMVEVLFTNRTYHTYALGDEVAAPERINRCAIFKVPFLDKFYVKYVDLKKACQLTYPPTSR